MAEHGYRSICIVIPGFTLKMYDALTGINLNLHYTTLFQFENSAFHIRMICLILREYLMNLDSEAMPYFIRWGSRPRRQVINVAFMGILLLFSAVRYGFSQQAALYMLAPCLDHYLLGAMQVQCS